VFFPSTKRTQTEGVSQHDIQDVIEPQREDISSGWGKLHGNELHTFYGSTNTIRLTPSVIMAGESM
jgi:hypothetical protein